jgi:DNA-binding helix-hairpin-helix protein with protein kinase domain
MPRLTPAAYLRHRQQLIRLWNQNEGGAFAVIPSFAQRDLHDYYAIVARMTNDQALEHRAYMTKAFPSLPSQAGRAYAALISDQRKKPNQMVLEHMASSTSTIQQGKVTRKIRVLTIAKPKPDAKILARALLALALTPDSRT